MADFEVVRTIVEVISAITAFIWGARKVATALYGVMQKLEHQDQCIDSIRVKLQEDTAKTDAFRGHFAQRLARIEGKLNIPSQGPEVDI